MLTPTLFYPPWNKTLKFSLIKKWKEQENFENYNKNFTGEEHQVLKYMYEKEWYVTSQLPTIIHSELTTYMVQLDFYYKWHETHENLAIKVPIIPLREDILQNNKEIKMYRDLFYTNGIPFLRTKICKITFLTVENFSWRIIYKIIQ